MGRLSKEELLSASDLVEREVQLPSIGGSVVVRSLPAAYSNEAASKALKMTEGARGEQVATVDTAQLEILQALHGLVEPSLNSEAEARIFATKCGRAFKEVIRVIDEISGVDKEAIETTEARFPVGVEGENGSAVGDAVASGSGGSNVHASPGAEAREVRA
jgi:hypothetical protein